MRYSFVYINGEYENDNEYHDNSNDSNIATLAVVDDTREERAPWN